MKPEACDECGAAVRYITAFEFTYAKCTKCGHTQGTNRGDPLWWL